MKLYIILLLFFAPGVVSWPMYWGGPPPPMWGWGRPPPPPMYYYRPPPPPYYYRSPVGSFLQGALVAVDGQTSASDDRILGLLASEISRLTNVAILFTCHTKKIASVSPQIRSTVLYTVVLEPMSEMHRKEFFAKNMPRLTCPEKAAASTTGFVVAELNALTYDARCRAAEEGSWPDVEWAIDKRNSSFADAIGAPKIPTVAWEDVGGLDEAKQLIRESLDNNLRATGGLRRSGIILYGPPGCGKTLLAKAVATEYKIAFLSVKGPELLNKYVGQSEENLRNVFERARAAAPCVIFFDELDSLAPNRGRAGDSGGVMDRVVSQLLAELDALHHATNKVFVMAATNRADLLDPSLRTPGRFDKAINVRVGNDAISRAHILRAVARKTPLARDVKLDEIARVCPDEMSGAELYSVISNATMSALREAVFAIQRGEATEENANVLVHRRHLLEAVEYNHIPMSLICLVGIPASGKTTLAQRLASALPQFRVFEFDEHTPGPSYHQFRKERLAEVEAHLQSSARSSEALLIDDTCHLQSMRRPYARLARRFALRFAEIYVECDLATALARNSRRQSVGRLEEATIQRVHERLEIPEDAFRFTGINFEDLLAFLRRLESKEPPLRPKSTSASVSSPGPDFPLDVLSRNAVAELKRQMPNSDGRLLSRIRREFRSGMNADELFNIEGVPCYVVFTADGPIEGGDPDAYFQRRSSGIIADIHDALEEAKENLVAHNTSANVIELEIVDKEPEADKEAEELPLLERTMNEEVEAEAGGLSGIAKQMAQLSMFGNEPKRVRRSQMEFQAMVKEKEAKEEKKTEDRGNTYNLRPRSSSNTRAGSSSQQQSQIPTPRGRSRSISQTRLAQPRAPSIEGRRQLRQPSPVPRRAPSPSIASTQSTSRRSASPASRRAPSPAPVVRRAPSPAPLARRAPSPAPLARGRAPSPAAQRRAPSPAARPVKPVVGKRVPGPSTTAAGPSGSRQVIVERQSRPLLPKRLAGPPAARPVAAVAVAAGGSAPVARQVRVPLRRSVQVAPTRPAQPIQQAAAARSSYPPPEGAGTKPVASADTTPRSISSWVERLSQPKLTPAVIAARERRRTADVAGPSRATTTATGAAPRIGMRAGAAPARKPSTTTTRATGAAAAQPPAREEPKEDKDETKEDDDTAQQK
ncbi:unnamed protein product, partial [Mesorhabditis spiculigera]